MRDCSELVVESIKNAIQHIQSPVFCHSERYPTVYGTTSGFWFVRATPLLQSCRAIDDSTWLHIQPHFYLSESTSIFSLIDARCSTIAPDIAYGPCRCHTHGQYHAGDSGRIQTSHIASIYPYLTILYHQQHHQ